MHCSAYVSSEKTIARKDKGETYMSRKVKFYRRIRDLREDSDMTQAQAAKKFHLDLNTYARYERGEARVPAEVIAKLAGYYEVATDYILELTDKKR